MEPRPFSAPFAAALVVLGVVLAVGPAFIAGFTICGISGCSGGGFGRSTDPGSTQRWLLATGLVAGLPLTLYALVRRSARLAAWSLAVMAAGTLLTGVVIGSDLRGCPRDVPHDMCVEESR